MKKKNVEPIVHPCTSHAFQKHESRPVPHMPNVHTHTHLQPTPTPTPSNQVYQSSTAHPAPALEITSATTSVVRVRQSPPAPLIVTPANSVTESGCARRRGAGSPGGGAHRVVGPILDSRSLPVVHDRHPYTVLAAAAQLSPAEVHALGVRGEGRLDVRRQQVGRRHPHLLAASLEALDNLALDEQSAVQLGRRLRAPGGGHQNVYTVLIRVNRGSLDRVFGTCLGCGDCQNMQTPSGNATRSQPRSHRVHLATFSVASMAVWSRRKQCHSRRNTIHISAKLHDHQVMTIKSDIQPAMLLILGSPRTPSKSRQHLRGFAAMFSAREG